MSDSFDSFSSLSDKGGDKELQEFLLVEKQKAQFNAQVKVNWSTKLTCFYTFFFLRYTSSVIFVGTSVWISLQVNWIVEPRHV